MSKTYIYIGNNEAREKGEVEQPSGSNLAEWGIYATYVNNLPRIKVHTDLAKTLKEGWEIVEGKDCIIEDQFWTGSLWWPTKHLIDGKTKKGTKVRTIALPLPTPPEEERNEAIEFAEWLDNERNKAINGQPVTIWNSKKMWASSEAFKQLYELFKTRNQ